jgi:DTW domain-containing protein
MNWIDTAGLGSIVSSARATLGAALTRRDNALVRCPRCQMHGSLCVCALIPRLETRTRVVVVIHRFEYRKPTNTGRLAIECLPNSEILVRGREGPPSPPLFLAATAQPVLLFPHKDAIPIARFAASPRPVTLVVPDGTWRQASKVRRRLPGLEDVPCVTVPIGEPSTYRLRTEAHEHGLATIEAIARALDILEGPHVREALERVFRVMVDRTLWARGRIDTGSVTGGVPEGAERHDPRSGLAANAGSVGGLVCKPPERDV